MRPGDVRVWVTDAAARRVEATFLLVEELPTSPGFKPSFRAFVLAAEGPTSAEAGQLKVLSTDWLEAATGPWEEVDRR